MICSFATNWVKGDLPKICYVFVVKNHVLSSKCNAYKCTLQHQAEEQYFHGTRLTCNVMTSKTLCKYTDCGICNISRIGFDSQHIRKNITFQHFGLDFYLAPHSSKCHDYTLGAHGYRAMFLCDVCPGRKYQLQITDQTLIMGFMDKLDKLRPELS